MFLAGVGAWLRLDRHGSRPALARYLVTRGIWLVALELVVMRLAMNFSLSLAYPVLLLVLWALGVSMIVLAVLIHLPGRVLIVVSVAVIALHNLLDGVQAARFGELAPVWNVLHQSGAFPLAGVLFVVGYPLVPWFAVMSAGFAFAPVLRLDPERRRRVLVVSGWTLVAGFLLLRGLNVYGDPSPWSSQSSLTSTVLSFLRTTKYPPSLQFLLMTLGPALILLAAFDRLRARLFEPLVVIGRVPLFFFVVHFFALHALVAVLSFLRYGTASFAFLFHPVPSMGGPAGLFPPGFGYSLGAVYLAWVGVVAALYPVCAWFAALKRRRPQSWWLSYL